MRFITLVRKNILERPARSALTACGVAIAVGAIVALVGIAHNFEQSQRAVFEASGVDLVVVRAGSIMRLGSVLDATLEERIRGLPGVRSVWPSLSDAVSLDQYGLFGVMIKGLPLHSATLEDVHVTEGHRIEQPDEKVVMLGNMLARNIDKKVGDMLEVIEGEPPYRVAAIYQSSDVFENGSMIMGIQQLRELLGREGEVTEFTVAAEEQNRESLERLGSQIEALSPGLETLPTGQYVDTAIQVLMARAVAWLTSTLALVIGTIGMVNTMFTSVFERTRELAILRAIGWRKRTIMKMILAEALVLGLSGAVAGTLAAVALTQLLSRLPASGRLVSGAIGLEVIFLAMAMAVFLSIVGGIYPAYRAAQAAPVEGFRQA